MSDLYDHAPDEALGAALDALGPAVREAARLVEQAALTGEWQEALNAIEALTSASADALEGPIYAALLAGGARVGLGLPAGVGQPQHGDPPSPRSASRAGDAPAGRAGGRVAAHKEPHHARAIPPTLRGGQDAVADGRRRRPRAGAGKATAAAGGAGGGEGRHGRASCDAAGTAGEAAAEVTAWPSS